MCATTAVFHRSDGEPGWHFAAVRDALVAGAWADLFGGAIGLVVAVQFLAVLLFGAYGGLIGDRVLKAVLLIGARTPLGSLALVLGVLVVAHAVRLWTVFAIAALLGTRAYYGPLTGSRPDVWRGRVWLRS